MRLAKLIALGCLLLSPVTAFAQPAPAATPAVAKPMFPKDTFDGWTQKGGKATYEIKDGEVIGTSVANTDNTFMCTDKIYSDFILEVDVKVDDTLNSGIQIRSEVFPERKAWEWKNADGSVKRGNIAANRVHGYQVEIDPSDRAWSGGIYDEARRAWLVQLDKPEQKAAREAFKKGDWNHYRIEAVGPVIKTSINGVPTAELKDEMTPKGFIALQVHSVGNDAAKIGKQVRWKNIMLTDLAPATP